MKNKIFFILCFGLFLLFIINCGFQHYFDEAVVNVYSYILDEEQFTQLLNTEHPEIEPINDTEIYSTRISKEHFDESLTFNEKSQSNHHREYWVQGDTAVANTWIIHKKFSIHDRLTCSGAGAIQTYELRGHTILKFDGLMNSRSTYINEEEYIKKNENEFVYKGSAKPEEVFLLYQKIESPNLKPHYHTLIISVTSTK